MRRRSLMILMITRRLGRCFPFFMAKTSSVEQYFAISPAAFCIVSCIRLNVFHFPSFRHDPDIQKAAPPGSSLKFLYSLMSAEPLSENDLTVYYNKDTILLAGLSRTSMPASFCLTMTMIIHLPEVSHGLPRMKDGGSALAHPGRSGQIPDRYPGPFPDLPLFQ